MPAPLSRRTFLAGAAAALAAPPLLRADPPASPLFGSQLYGWGQYYSREGRKLDDHLDEVLAAVRDIGFDYAEHGLDAGRPENNARFADRLRAKGLRPVSLYTGGRLHEEGRAMESVARLAEAAKAARAAGFTVLVCNPDPVGRAKTDDELRTQAEALRALGAALNAFDMRLALHHHLPEMADGAREFHFNFRHAPADVVGFCYDVHWVFRGGLRPDVVLPAYGGRVASWHLRQSRAGTWWETLAEGDVDYPAVARFAREHKLAPRWTVELALEEGTRVTRSVVENHRLSLAYAREVFAG